MLESLAAEEWDEMLQFYNLEPFGPAVDDLRHGVQCAVTAAPHMPKGRKANPHDFLVGRPPEPPAPRQLTTDETVSVFRALLGGRVRTS